MDNMLGIKDIKGIVADLLEKLGSDNWQEWFTEVKKFLRKEPCWVQKITQAVRSTITVVSNLTLEQRIALGKYDLRNSDINEKRFPNDLTTIGEWEYDLDHPNCSISSEDEKLRAEVDGWTVGKAEHLLAFAEAFPDEQRKYPIIALGSVCGVIGLRYVLGLSSDDGRRKLYLYGWDGGWDSSFRFLRVRKVQPLNT